MKNKNDIPVPFFNLSLIPTLASRFGPSRGDNYYDLTSFDISSLLSLLDALIVEFPVIVREDASTGNNAYISTRAGQDLFFITKDFYTFSIEDNAFEEEGQIVFYLNEFSQLAINFESQLLLRTVTAVQDNVDVPAPQTAIIFALGALLLLHKRRKS